MKNRKLFRSYNKRPDSIYETYEIYDGLIYIIFIDSKPYSFVYSNGEWYSEYSISNESDFSLYGHAKGNIDECIERIKPYLDKDEKITYEILFDCKKEKIENLDKNSVRITIQNIY